MEPLTLHDLEREGSDYDALVSVTPEIDTFCTSSLWAVPAHEALMPPREPWIWRGEGGYVALARGFEERLGHYLQPLEGMWGFCSGIVASEPAPLLAAMGAELRASRIPWNMVLLSGLTPGGAVWSAALRAFGARHRMGSGIPATRHRASLEGGVEGFLSRRSRKLRQNLRRAARTAAEAGITFERVEEVGEAACEAIYARILAVERRSWKWAEGGGLHDRGMQGFYRAMLPRLARRGALRVTFARQGERDVAYILGGVMFNGYRGLQMSFDDALRHLSLGNLLQWAAIQDAAAEGLALYDLGGEIAYKAHWSDDNLTTQTLAIFR